MTEPKIVLLDIETAPSLVYVYDHFPKSGTNVVATVKDWFILSFSWKELGAKKTNNKRLCDYPGYSKNKECDRKLVKDLWKILDEFDVAIAHNGNRFDLRKIRARCLAHGFPPFSPILSIDTLVSARRYFKFDSNRLDAIGQYTGVGRKLQHDAKGTMLGCLAGDMKCWDVMGKYNNQDVELLERVYLPMRPWMVNHPKLTHFTRAAGCPTCQSTNTIARGFAYTATGKRQRFSCRDCGAWSTTGPLIKDAA